MSKIKQKLNKVIRKTRNENTKISQENENVREDTKREREREIMRVFFSAESKNVNEIKTRQSTADKVRRDKYGQRLN